MWRLAHTRAAALSRRADRCRLLLLLLRRTALAHAHALHTRCTRAAHALQTRCTRAALCALLLQEWHAGKRRRKQKDLCYSSQRFHESNARSFLERARRRGRERLQHTEDFSYLLVRRAPALAPDEPDGGAAQGGWGRLVRPPRKRKGHVLLDLCMPSGDVVSEAISSAVVSQLAYRRARKAKQGRIWPLDLMRPEAEAEDEYEYEYYDEE